MKIPVALALAAAIGSIAQGVAVNYPPRPISVPAVASVQAPNRPQHVNRDEDPNASLLGQLLTPLKTILTRLLKDAEAKLEETDAKSLADVLRGPVGDLKTYLISIWPDVPPMVPASAPPPSPHK
ncbi:hypothetical protein IWW55_001129 [Coemansia sp. RSA 2706]|nr:hypothetical protein IWW55_001129 [Coemansia sp. RSA 2706]